MARVTVFASSRKSNPSFVSSAKELGKLLAEKGCVCVNGGGRFGCMGALNEGTKENGGKIVGIIHQMFVVDFGEYNLCDELLVSKGMNCYWNRYHPV